MEKRINLRDYKLEDLDDYFKCVNDEKINEFLPFVYCNSMKVAESILKMKIEAQRRYNNSNIIYAIEDITINHIIGEISVKIKDSKAKITCFLNSKYRGKSYAQEAVSQLVVKIKERKLNISVLEAEININNMSSKKAFEKLNFVYKGTDRENDTYQREL